MPNFYSALVRSVNIDGFCPQLLYEISKYLDKPYESLGVLNKTIKRTYDEGRVSLILLSEKLNMPEIAYIETKDTEGVNEVLGIVTMPGEAKHVFMTLYKAVFEWQICPSLQLHLVKYLKNIYRNIRPIGFESIDINFDKNCAGVLTAIDEFRLLLEWYGHDVRFYYNNIYKLSHDKKKQIYQIILRDENLSNSYRMLLSTNNPKYRDVLLADAVVYNIPESWYTSFIVFDKLFEVFDLDLDEQENIVLHQKMNRIIDIVQDSNIKRLARVLNDVRFGSLDDCDALFKVTGKLSVIRALKVSFFSNKKNLFNDLVRRYVDSHLGSHVSSALTFFSKSDCPFNVNIYFEIQKLLNRKRVQHFDSPIAQFLKKFCFISELKAHGTGKLFEVTFKASQRLLQVYRFPEQVKLILDYEESTLGGDFISEFWNGLKTETPEQLNEILTNFLKLKKIRRFIAGIKAAKYGSSYDPVNSWKAYLKKDFKEGYEYERRFIYIVPSYETTKMIIKNQYLKSTLADNEIKVLYSGDFVYNFVKDNIDFDVSDIQIRAKVIFEVLKYTKNCIEIGRLEMLYKRNIAEIFLSKEITNDIDFYYDYRHCFIYWINGPQKQRIAELSSDVIKKHLNQEYPGIMRKILN